MSTVDLTGKVALVTGASRGVGKHTARSLHAVGATVGITGRSAETLGATAAEIGARCHPFVCDQSDPSAIEAMAASITAQLGVPDILVNNAAALRSAPVLTCDLELWNNVIQTNLTGVFLTTKAFLPGMMKRQRGDIFMISSMSGKKGDEGSAPYCASKFGLQGFSQSLLYEVRRHNIRVMVLNPSAISTGPDRGPKEGPGLYLHAADLGETIAYLAALPGRTLFRDMDIWGTNPFK